MNIKTIVIILIAIILILTALYEKYVADGEEPYLDEKGVCKFECIVNDSQIPGIPLPGTYQYGRPVKVLNKEDFIKSDEEKEEDLL